MTIKETETGTAVLPRVMGCFVNQRKRALVCPEFDDLKGRVIAITGATNGIGLETAKALVDAGALVLLMIRDAAKGRNLLAEWQHPDNAVVVTLDLSDLATISKATEQIQAVLQGRVIDTLIENAGVSPQKYAQTVQGHEIAFGTNVLGHFALRNQLQSTGLLATSARVVIITGDIYITTNDCTPDFRYKTIIGATKAYSRSKLGNIWIGQVLQERFPELVVTLVHPGVVNSGLMMGDSPLEQMMKKILLPTPLGAQTSLFCVTQPVTPGGYYHNTRGLVHLKSSDPAMNKKRQNELWEECQVITNAYMAEHARDPRHAS